jgi:glutamine synthetase
MSDPDTAGRDSDLARLGDDLAAQGVVGVAVSYVDNSGIARVKTVPVARLEHAATGATGRA